MTRINAGRVSEIDFNQPIQAGLPAAGNERVGGILGHVRPILESGQWPAMRSAVVQLNSHAPTAPLPPQKLMLHNKAASNDINQMMMNPAFWAGADISDYHEEFRAGESHYDEIRFKETPNGLRPKISGEVQIPADVVAQLVFRNQDLLPDVFSRVLIIHNLGQGYDSEVGAYYQDNLQVLDADFFNVTYMQRMYYRKDESTGAIYLWFEKLTSERFPDVYARHRAEADRVIEENDDKLGLFFTGMVEPSGFYGGFVLTPTAGKQRTRVSVSSVVNFSNGLVQVVSQLQPIVEKGLQDAFEAYTAIAQKVLDKQSKLKPMEIAPRQDAK
ncbi:MAG: hypothetical protein Q7T11_08895 [Deltaproteobacteria bacterium]|nr:hypothetical protein [Deltaproteobacteria bacterium]